MSSAPAPEASAPRRPRLRGVAIAGLGTALPPRIVDNDDATAGVPVDAAWVVRRTGILERRWADAGTRLSDLAASAADAALDDAAVAAADVDLVLVATCTADQLTPATAPQVAAAIGAIGAGALDVGAACSGFISAVALGTAMLESGRSRCTLVIGAEILSRHLDRHDRQTTAIFGDGAGAVVLRAGTESRVGPVVLGSDGTLATLIEAPRDTGLIRMDGQDVFREAVGRMGDAAIEACAAAGVTLDEIDVFVFHQANARILRTLTERLGLDPARVVEAIALTGNTSAASIPLALAHARAAGRLDPGARVLVAAFGAGLTWAASVVTWGRDV